MLRQRLDDVRERIRRACQRCGRDPSSVTLVCVTKGIPTQTIQDAITLGVTDIGENRIQEARTKQLALGSPAPARVRGGPRRLEALGTGLQPPASSLQPIRWHLIGHLQRNKARDAVELFHLVHSVDSLALVEELERHSAKQSRQISVFIQVNVSGEATKHGCPPDDTEELARAVQRTTHLRLTGLMTMAPFSNQSEAARPHFRGLRELRDELTTTLSLEPSALSLSMGMSQDFEVAIEEGADLVRIGTAIFA